MIDLARTSSPGGLAAQFLLRAGVWPPMETLVLTEAEPDEWTSAFYGGWCEAHPGAIGRVFPTVVLDIMSCFPLVAYRICWWDLVCAQRVERVDVTARVVDICQQVPADPKVVLHPGMWRELGCTVVNVSPRGERWPVTLQDQRRPDGRMEVTRVHSPDLRFTYAWPDVVCAAMDADQPLQIHRATALRPVGRQSGIRTHLDVFKSLRIDLSEDPVLPLVGYRRMVKNAGNRVLAAELRVFVNALIYGIFCRFDPIRHKIDGEWVNRERPGSWVCMPIASTVTAGSRLLLGVLDRLVRDLGSVVLYRDTDSSIVLATPSGDELVLVGSDWLRCPSWAEIDEIAAHFDPLSPSPNWPVWQIKKGESE
jgi:hypothetical protein